jgi:hypothetical protein
LKYPRAEIKGNTTYNIIQLDKKLLHQERDVNSEDKLLKMV